MSPYVAYAQASIGHWSQGAAWAPDCKTLLVGNMVQKDYRVVQWNGSTLKDTAQRAKRIGAPAAIRATER